MPSSVKTSALGDVWKTPDWKICAPFTFPLVLIFSDTGPLVPRPINYLKGTSQNQSTSKIFSTVQADLFLLSVVSEIPKELFGLSCKLICNIMNNLKESLQNTPKYVLLLEF
jgi:hypothetical protein